MKSKNNHDSNGKIDDKYNRNDEQHGKKKKTKKKSGIKKFFIRFLIVLLMIIAILLGVVVSVAYDKYSKLQIDEIDKNEIEVNEGVEAKGYLTYVLYGVDARNQDNSYSGSLSDAIMIVSINQDTKKVKIASVYRDTYLQNPKTKSFDKITHAFQSGPALSMSMLNTNLDLNITEYVAVNFNVVSEVIDAVRWN